MATNKERTSSAAMRKLLLQSASKKEQEIQQIGSVAESTIPNLRLSTPSMKRWKNRLQSKKPSKNLSRNKWKSRNQTFRAVFSKNRRKQSLRKKFSEYLEERKLKNTEVIRISSETHRKLKQIAMATGLGMHNIANNILEDILTSHNKEIQAILKKYMSIWFYFRKNIYACSTASVGQALFLHTVLVKAGIEPGHFYTTAENPFAYYPGQYVKEFKPLLVSTSKFFPKVRIR